VGLWRNLFSQVPNLSQSKAAAPQTTSAAHQYIRVPLIPCADKKAVGRSNLLEPTHQLTFTNPLFENYYLLTVGEEGLATTAPAPEPASLTLLGSALAGLGWFSRRRRKSA
jgi:hypothetical protein